MIYIFLLLLLFLSPTAWLAPLTVVADDHFQFRTFKAVIDRDDNVVSTVQHRLLVRPKPEPLAAADENVLTFETKTISVAGQTITRSIPLLDGLPVEGADGIFNELSDTKHFYFTQFDVPRAAFRLHEAEAIERVMAAQQEALITDPYVETMTGFTERLWLVHFGQVRPVFKVRLPTLSIFDLKDVYIDAETGEMLRYDDAAQFAQAPADVFVYAPSSNHLSPSELKQVMLPNLVDVKEDGFLAGEFVSVRTCCRYYTCPEEGECTDDRKRCALRSHENARQSRELLTLPTDTLGLDALISLPPELRVDSVRCTYLPFARASKKPGSSVIGFFDTPIDEPGIPSEMDRFSEIQAYFSVMSFFNNIRSLLNDSTWCLRPEAMSCNTDGSPVLDDKGHPTNPYRVFVNQLIPDMKVGTMGQNARDNFIEQAVSGKGKGDNPIVLNDFIRFSNAAFIPALSTLKKSTPRADEILSDLIKPYDHNVFFQGDKDFAYDGDVVFHEFMHAITTSLIGKINSLGLDKWGINSEPGGLNEAWSDYFAAAFTSDPKVGQYANVQDGYGEVALRNIDNNASCPNDVIGEIHNDGLIWSGALWEIRKTIQERISEDAVVQFDRAVLASLSQAKTSEDFKAQSEKLINNIRARDGLGERVVTIAEDVFTKRGVRDCFRAISLSRVDKANKLTTSVRPMLFVPSKNQIGLKNFAPSAAQLEIGIPAGAKSLTLSWRQYLGATGALLGTETTPETARNMVPLSILANFSTPISWQFRGATAHATDGKNDITTAVGNANFEHGQWHYTMPLSLERCEQKLLYMSLLSNDFKYVLQNLTVNFAIDTSDDRSDCDYSDLLRGAIDEADLGGCSSHDGPNLFIIIFLALVVKIVLRKRSWHMTP